MKYIVDIEIETADEETAYRMYAALIGVSREQLSFAEPGYSFGNATCIPSALTYFLPASVSIRPAK